MPFHMPFHSTRAAALAAILAAAPAALPAHEAPERPVIVVSGEGRASAPPDLAVLRLGVEARAETAGAALAAASTAAAAILAALRGAGVAEADARTSELALRPDHGRDYDASTRPDAYVASNVVTARVRDLDALGAVVDAAAGAGANRIDGLAFEVSDPAAALAEARRGAVEDAALAARTLAEAAGVSLGPVLRIAEGGGGGPPFRAATAARFASEAIAPGEVGITASVTVTYALGDGAP